MMKKNYSSRFVKTLVFIGFVFVSIATSAQDLIMQNGTFNRCAPDRFFDTGGEFGSYGSNENFTITICPTTPGEVIILDFTRFSTQAGSDILTIYDGDSTASPVINNYSGTVSPGRVSSTHPSGCLTVSFSSNGFGNTIGWEATIECAAPCQTITAMIDSTTPAINTVTNQIEILPSQTVSFNVSATFSDTGANATYLWDFGTGGTANTLNTSHQFNTSGTYNVTFTASDDNPLGCSDTVTITVVVAPPFVTINNAAFPESYFLPSELIENVLVTGGCSAVSNFQSQVFGGPADITSKSYGYFTRGGTDFPFDEGIVITNGNAFGGGNTFIPPGPGADPSQDNGFGSDIDITNLGLPNNVDANFIKFDFTPTTDNISFRYVMASEEYIGNFECQYSDVFAFLLRVVGSGAPYQNLAVLPDGITPVSVTNITNEPSCSMNPMFFAGENLGATNYFGRTEVLTATATVIPNVTYEIKLVVADGFLGAADATFDSAIFIEAGSFNLGGDLGDDITLAAGTAPCGVLEDVTLDTQAPDATHTWYFNGMPIAGAGDGPTLTVTEAGTYSVDVEFAPGCSTSDSILVEFRNSPRIVSPAIDLAGCSTSGVDVFNLAQNTPIVFGSQSDAEFAITYHNSQADADTGANPISNLTNYNGTDGEMIYIRIDDITTEQCVVTDMFELEVFTSVTAENVIYPLCDSADDGDDTNGRVEFNLSTRDLEVLGIQDPTQFSVSYHISDTDAMMGLNPLPNLYTNTTANSQVIYARVQNNSNIDCFATSEVTLQVDALPVITASVDIRQCDDNTADGLSFFNLTEANDEISSNFAAETFTYYISMTDAENQINPITNELAYPNTDASAAPDILYVRVENNTSCFRIAQLNLYVDTSQTPPGFVIPPFEECDDTRVDDNITDGITVFDFSSATGLIEALFPVGQNVNVTYYESVTDALGELNAIPDPSNHINTAFPFTQTIFYRVENDANEECQFIGDFELRTTNPTPRTDTESVDMVLCDDVTIGDLSEEFDLTQNEAFIFDGQPNLSATYFTDYNDALNNVLANEITTPAAYNNVNTNETIYIRVVDTVTGCFAIVDFDITVNPLPEVIAVTPLEECEVNTDFIFDFNLGDKRDEILNGQDPAMFNVTFHINQLDADNLANPQPDLFTNTVDPQEIFFAITNTTTGCSNSTGSFFLDVFEGAQANPDGEPLDFELCDDNIENDGVAQFNLALLQDEILDGQDPADYTITYHFSEEDARDNQSPLPFLYENLTNPQTIWVRVSNNISPDLCFEVQPIPLRVNPLPEFDLDELYILCITTNGSEVVPVPPVLDTGLSATDYSFEWSLDGAVLPTETGSTLIPTQGGTYSVLVTDITTSTLTRCTNMDEAIVLESELPVVVAEVTSQAFAGNHTIEATTTNVGDFEYSLDLGPWQDNGTFENVAPGNHTVYARDINGCGIGSDTVLVIDYPLFFTPNGDGSNDTWNIVGIDTQPSAKIYIFDRYGKLMKQLSPTSPGWDGTYQGNKMPTDDYWFTVEYVEPLTNELKQQRAHFTLKR
ncbi:choice-of-anchor L domain-containing protein [Winogradskyella jejuensis]|uniref:Gliding motility-associated C-terminal domain-containing protein n=1 Tax=Winogradskyella jejuensis TaxID=1089305 RepID=A0A1M5LRL0_9FLAO|nr:choice-of-anchor L domain-containing protein [Winogradskyella jejuensis]SHG67764.1 gliding motility-associated C-terminal domain-containing protein [Winogradskyella jejuensis]